VLVGCEQAVRDAWWARCAIAGHDPLELPADRPEAVAAEWLERISAELRARATVLDLRALWSARAAVEGTDDASRLALALFGRPGVGAGDAIRTAFGVDRDAGRRALRAAFRIALARTGLLLQPSAPALAADLIWDLDGMDGLCALGTTGAAWQEVVAAAPRAAARCRVEEVPGLGRPDRVAGRGVTVPPDVAALRVRTVRAIEAAAESEDPALERAARSAAEAFLTAVLAARPRTAGRFELNAHPGFAFGDRPCEVDLLAGRERVAIEIDGFRHFADDEAFRRDRRKDLALQRHGFVVIRVLAVDVVERLETILATIDSTLDWRSEG
jgi:hypothetical protein